MNRAISTKSVRSFKSAKSLKSGIESAEDLNTDDISEYLINACEKFNCGYKIVVLKELLRDDYYKTLKKLEPGVKYKKITVATSSINQRSTNEDSDTQFAGSARDGNSTVFDSDTIAVKAIYDNLQRLVELSLSTMKEVPRSLMQIIGFLVPYYKLLRKITIKNSSINKYTTHELRKMLPLSNITEICLDGSYLPEANYAVLLDGQKCLRCLSLSKCRINNDVCKQIFSKLHYGEPSEPTLAVLNLSSNHITDEGVKYVGEALRTNRQLRYLNLADNSIGDDGALHLFIALVEFPLTYEEVVDKRRRYYDYLITKRELYAKCLRDFDSKSVDDSIGKRSTNKKKSKAMAGSLNQKASGKMTDSYTDDYMSVQAEMMSQELMGPFQVPYCSNSVTLKDGYSHCIGNLVLCYLNLAYNNLSYLSLKKLLAVVQYQQMVKAKSGQCGLMKVLIEGNCMPVACAEMVALNEILQRNIGCFSSRSTIDKTLRRKSMRMSVVK